MENLPASAGDPGSIPGLGISPEGGHGNPLQYSCLENPMDRGAWQATVHGVEKESVEQLSIYTQPKLTMGANTYRTYCAPGLLQVSSFIAQVFFANFSVSGTVLNAPDTQQTKQDPSFL